MVAFDRPTSDQDPLFPDAQFFRIIPLTAGTQQCGPQQTSHATVQKRWTERFWHKSDFFAIES
jgi:hypothetical protein